MSYQFQVYGKMIQLYIYMYLFFRFFSHLSYHRILGRVPCTTKHWRRLEKREPSYSSQWECKLAQPVWRAVWRLLKKWKTEQRGASCLTAIRSRVFPQCDSWTDQGPLILTEHLAGCRFLNGSRIIKFFFFLIFNFLFIYFFNSYNL